MHQNNKKEGEREGLELELCLSGKALACHSGFNPGERRESLRLSFPVAKDKMNHSVQPSTVPSMSILVTFLITVIKILDIKKLRKEAL